MARGPKPQPAAVKAAKGNPSRRPIGHAPVDAPTAAANAVRAPAWLAGDALVIWEGKAAMLSAARLLTEADANAFGRYCVNHAKWQKMHKVLDAEGEIYEIETASGKVFRPRPQFVIAERLERMLLAAEDRFGLNPSERQRIFASRASSGVVGDFFASQASQATEPTSPTEPAKPAPAAEGPIGLLN